MARAPGVWATVSSVAAVVALSACGRASNVAAPDALATAAGVTKTSSSSTPLRASPSDYGVPYRLPERDDDYLRCARAMGFDPEVAEVIADGSGKPMTVKTGIEVPARVHRACLLEIGGHDRPQSSYGNPPVFESPG